MLLLNLLPTDWSVAGPFPSFRSQQAPSARSLLALLPPWPLRADRAKSPENRALSDAQHKAGVCREK